jgi:hypothetical protein
MLDIFEAQILKIRVCAGRAGKKGSLSLDL